MFDIFCIVAILWFIHVQLCCRHDISCLKVIGTVGEPINPDAWHWYYEVVGSSKCSIPDTYWQTETVRLSLYMFDLVLGHFVS